MYDIILGFITAFFITYLAIPSIINVSFVKNLFDKPGERSSHTRSIPTLGGFGIFAGTSFAITFWTPFSVFSELQYILCALIIIFLFGAKDDIVPLSPGKKLMGQLLAASILAVKADVRISSFYGVFGIGELPYWVSTVFSIFTIIVINNAFNLIDGINGLAGTVSVLICITFGTWFFMIDELELAVVAFCLTGSLLAFLKYNYTPAKIFMGDTGSLFIGLVCSILAIKFMEINKVLDPKIAIYSIPAVTMGIMVIPLFDTLRVFFIRVLQGRSPFSPDKNHLHHLLLNIGCSHLQATFVLTTFNALFIFMVFKLQSLGSVALLLIELIILVIGSSILQYLSNKALDKNLLTHA
jgi:UDP-N-acetylmuramyl pentapeptide phosphotransferase/UDP-N-acetylglucosamine-1-phosphate transferase